MGNCCEKCCRKKKKSKKKANRRAETDVNEEVADCACPDGAEKENEELRRNGLGRNGTKNKGRTGESLGLGADEVGTEPTQRDSEGEKETKPAEGLQSGQKFRGRKAEENSGSGSHVVSFELTSESDLEVQDGPDRLATEIGPVENVLMQ